MLLSMSPSDISIFPGNVHLRSEYDFELLCEKRFLSAMFSELANIMKAEFARFHFVICSGGSGDDLEIETPAETTVVIVISDEHARVPLGLCSRTRLVFKSYLPGEGLTKNLYSFPLGYVESTASSLEKLSAGARPIRVFFSGNLNGQREPLLRALGTPMWCPRLLPAAVVRSIHPSLDYSGAFRNSYVKFTSGFRQGLSGEDYGAMLERSKIVICPPGFYSVETFRHFEAMRAGCVVVTAPLPPLYFYEGAPHMVLHSWKDLKSRINGLLGNAEALQERQNLTLEWWRARCSEQATARRIAAALAT
ncbi:hypothetical protein [Prosthecomicrobium pneumaticum]|uniref:Exostosin GT47 domain-containing protein n=1 Tax=Prosthecomicrobium pneumaticum TaxID=81895 RepID=A0A7W9CUH9_9HYPH|nr:hypothetical protein [Prosthecomicrobium pneumaticum]MBB5751884.1 hypothetical protein [Prosthecomicrobium pneumaticum]